MSRPKVCFINPDPHLYLFPQQQCAKNDHFPNVESGWMHLVPQEQKGELGAAVEGIQNTGFFSQLPPKAAGNAKASSPPNPCYKELKSMTEGRGPEVLTLRDVFNGRTVFLSHPFIIHLCLRAGGSRLDFIWKKNRPRNSVMSSARHVSWDI